MIDTAPIYSISSAAKLLGVPVATLRTWEDRYGLVVPERTPSRHRLYTRRQIEQLRFVKSQMDRGASAADAHRLLRERMQGGGFEAQESSFSEQQPERRHLILVAENDPYAAELQEHFLQSEGYEVQVALGLDAARRALEQGVPSLVVLELLISGGLGLDLCRTIKHRDHPPPVLAVSTLDSQDRALGAGADAFLPKPLDPQTFTSTVHTLLRTSRSTTKPAAAAS